jgi:hypothetical protein
MSLILNFDGTPNNSYHTGIGTEDNPYFWDEFSNNIYKFPYPISLTSYNSGFLYIQYYVITTDFTSSTVEIINGESCVPYLYHRPVYIGNERIPQSDAIPIPIYPKPSKIAISSGSTKYITFDLSNCNTQNIRVNQLSIWFKESSLVTSTTLEPNISTDSKVFIHVGDINLSNDACGRYKLTLEGNDSEYFAIYGKRIYLTKYPPIAKTYSINVCAKDIASRFTPVCDTFNIDITQCKFTTEPPTTTPAPNYGFVQVENNINTVTEYTYNKIYSMRNRR